MRCTAALQRVLLPGLLIVLLISQTSIVSAGFNVWTSIGPEGGYIQSLAINPTTPSTIYAGTDDGVFKSTNGGGNWSPVNTGLPEYTRVRALAIDPVTPATLYVGSWDSVFKTTNAGGNWITFNSGLTYYTDSEALVVDPAKPTILYAGTDGGGAFAIQQVDSVHRYYLSVTLRER